MPSRDWVYVTVTVTSTAGMVRVLWSSSDASSSDPLQPAIAHPVAGDEVTDLNLEQAGITSIVWAGGFSFDFGWVRYPIFDPDGYPVQKGGITAVPGLYFVGLPWLSKYKSGLLVGVGEDAERVAHAIAGVKVSDGGGA
jgi:putative flavoprotein involved in K+ transport